MPARKRKQQQKPKKPVPRSRPQPAASATQAQTNDKEGHQNQQADEESKRPQMIDFDDEEFSALSTHEIKAMVDRTAEFADSLQFSSVGDLQSHMQNTISQMRGDKTVTDTTASVSNAGGGIGLQQRNPRQEEDELGLSQLASAVNQISAAQSYQNSVITGHGSNLMWIEDEMAAENAQYLQKTQIYDTSQNKDGDQGPNQSAMLSNFFESSALQYEKVGQAAPSHESTFIKEDVQAADQQPNNDQLKLLTPGLLQQLMLNSEQLLNQKIGARHKKFAPFELSESHMDNQTKIDLLIGAQFDEPSHEDDKSEPAPVLGLNLKEYFQKRHLVDHMPVEPLPPIENPLEMTQNHEDWVRGQEDFKINHEQLQSLHQPEDRNRSQILGSNNIFSSELAADVFNPHDAQKELAKLQENIKSVTSSFDKQNWAALTQKHKRDNSHALSLTHTEEEMQKLLEIESHKDNSLSSSNKHDTADSHILRQFSNDQNKSFQSAEPISLSKRQRKKLNAKKKLNQQKPKVFQKEQDAQLIQTIKDYPIKESDLASESQATFVEHHAQSEQLEVLSPSMVAKEVFDALKQNILESPQLNEKLAEGSLSRIDANDDKNNLESFISQPELQQLLQLESSLYNLLQETAISDFMVPNRQNGFDDEEYESLLEPVAPKVGGSLKNLEDFMIKGDLRNCVLCNSKYTEGDPSQNIAPNIPRVLYCGDSLCESCITKHIQRASITEKAHRNVAACQVICPVCDLKHLFKLTKTGFLVCNDKYIKVQDEKGPVNFFPSSKINPNTLQLDKDTLELNLMDNSISIPNSLIVRSLPVNIELMELLKTSRHQWNRSQIEMSVISSEPSVKKQSTSRNVKEKTVKNKEFKSVPDLEQHMSAFNVEEIVREYEKEILQKLTESHDQLKSEQPARDPRETLKELRKQKNEAKDGINNQSSASDHTKVGKLSSVQTAKEDLEMTTSQNQMRMLHDMHSKFDGKRESSQEERARRNRKAPERKRVGQSFKLHNHNPLSSAGSSNQTISAGNNASAQAIFKKKKMARFMQQRRDISYSSSSSDAGNYIGRLQTFGKNDRHTAGLFEGIGASNSAVDAVSNPDEVTVVLSKENQDSKMKKGDYDYVAAQQRSTSMEKLIPVDLDLEQLDFTRHQKSMRCDRLSDGSDMSPEELVSENSLKRVSMEMFQASQQVNLNSLSSTNIADLFASNAKLQRDPTSGEFLIHAQSEDLIKAQQELMRQWKIEQPLSETLQQTTQVNQTEDAKQKLIDTLSLFQQRPTMQQLIEEEQKFNDTAIQAASMKIDTQTHNLSEFEKMLDQAEIVSPKFKIPFSKFPVEPIQEDSAGKKKAKRNKKKRRKQQLMLQAQRLTELMNGHQISEECENDLYTMLVPVEETELQPDSLSKHGAVKFKYKLSIRDYFDSEQLYDGDVQMATKADSLTSFGPNRANPTDDQARISMTCSNCSIINQEQPLWFKCDQKSDENINFEVCNGQAEADSTFQFNKTQQQVMKELIDLGMLNVATHYCEPCNVEAQQAQDKELGGKIKGYKDVIKMCLCCTLQHRIDHANHNFVMLMPLQFLKMQLKRSEQLETLARHKIGQIQQIVAQKHFNNLLQVIQELVLDKNHDLYTQEANQENQKKESDTNKDDPDQQSIVEEKKIATD